MYKRIVVHCLWWALFRTISHFFHVLKGKKYLKRSELERISRGVDEDSKLDIKRERCSPPPGSSGVQGEESGGKHLLSPTSIVAPPEMEAAIFSIPRSEVWIEHDVW